MRYRAECMPLVSSVDTVYYCYDLRMAQLYNRNAFSPCFLCRNVFPVLRYTPSHAISQTKRVCVMKHQFVVKIILERVQIMSMCPKYQSRGRGRSHSKCCWVAFSGATIVINTSSFYSCARLPRLSIYVRTYLPRLNK